MHASQRGQTLQGVATVQPVFYSTDCGQHTAQLLCASGGSCFFLNIRCSTRAVAVSPTSPSFTHGSGELASSDVSLHANGGTATSKSSLRQCHPPPWLPEVKKPSGHSSSHPNLCRSGARLSEAGQGASPPSGGAFKKPCNSQKLEATKQPKPEK